MTLDSPLGSGTLSGTLSVATVNGVATFSDLSVSSAGFLYTLTAASGSTTRGADPFNVGF